MSVALTIAGSDPSGGAGLQADLKTFTALGVYGMSAVTLLTVQNTRGVARVEVLAPSLVREQIRACLGDIPPGAVKLGALGTAPIIQAVADELEGCGVPLVVDPVMVSKHGHPLLDDAAVAALRERIFPLADVVTPNRFEAARLAGRPVPRTPEELEDLAGALLGAGASGVLLKGSGIGGRADDLLATPGGLAWLPGDRLESTSLHGTGCVLSAALTAHLAMGLPLGEAAESAKRFTRAAIAEAPGLGGGVHPTGIVEAARLGRESPVRAAEA